MLLVRLVPCFAIIATMISISHAAPSPKLLLVDDYEGGQQNHLGGFQEKYQAGDSVAVFNRTTNVARGRGGRSLCIEADRRASGYCGVWTHFFNFRAPQKQYFDARAYGFLSFWVRGQKGGERFTIKLADKSWIEKEDSLAVAEIGRLIPKGVTTNWQEVLIPLAGLKTLDLQHLGGITIDFDSPGRHVIYIDDLSFKVTASVATPQIDFTSRMNSSSTTLPRAMWVWTSRDIINDKTARQTLFSFCRREGVEQLWMQIEYKLNVDNTREVPVRPVGLKARTAESKTATRLISTTTCRLTDADGWRQFLADAHEARLQVHALDGYPEFALKTHHAVPLAVVDAIIDFNRESETDQRFDGIHFDNEPYLILAWEDRVRREQILREFLELNVECQRRIRQTSGLKFGIDIPFWWNDADPKTGRPIGEVTFAGKKKPAGHHCIDLLDHVGVMNYRDAADGADGMIAHGQDLIAYSKQSDGAQLLMGVETFLAPPIDVWFVAGLPRRRFEAAVRGPARELANLSRLDNFRLRTFDDGQNIHVGLELPAEPTDEDLTKVQHHLRTLAEQFGTTVSGTARSQSTSSRDSAESTLRRDPEWRGFRNRDIVTIDGDELPGFMATNIMLPKITFADNAYDDFVTQLKSAEASFRQSKRFFGMAIHSYETFQKLAGTRSVSSPP